MAEANKNDDRIEIEKIFKTATLAGELISTYGGETYRVEETVKRILDYSGRTDGSAFATPTGVFVSLGATMDNNLATILRVDEHTVDFSKIVSVNEVSRQLCTKNITVDDAYKQLCEIKNRKGRIKGSFPAMIVVVVAFTAMFGGSFPEMIVAAAAGTAAGAIVKIVSKFGVKLFFTNFTASLGIAVIAYLGKYLGFSSYDMDLVIIGGIMPYVPGMAITNAVFDMLHGDYLAGGGKALEALVSAAGISVGVFIGLVISQMLGGGF